MKKYESFCVDCGQQPCIGCTDIVYYCDRCDNEKTELYEYDNEELCRDCIEEELEADKKLLLCEICGDMAEIKLDDSSLICRDCYFGEILRKVE